ncbi:MAG: TonB-dependent receptor, partial [FCB group bacterium]|nr:TonB-dependent receptor [FCB group bacterium]
LGERWKFRTTLGTGYRRPTFMDRYIDWNHIQFGYQVIGNPDLKPERSLGFTAGLEYYSPQIYRVSVLAYVTRFEDMINDYAIRPGYLSYQNIDRVLFRGLEIQGRWTVSRSMLARWGLNWVDNRNSDTGDLIPNTQPFTADGSLSFRVWKQRVDGTLRFKWTAPYHPQEYVPEIGDFVTSATPRSSFVLWNLTTTIHVLSWLDIHAGLDNMTDYIDNHYGPFIGRRFYLELRTNLQGKMP